MQWIEGVERRGSTWGVLISEQGQDGTEWQPASQLNTLKPTVKPTCRRRFSTDLSVWTNSSANDYLALLGDERIPTDEQKVFSFHDGETEYLVPTIVLIQAFFRPLHHLAPWLFHPTSLEGVSAPCGGGSAFAARLTIASKDPHYADTVASTSLFTWMWAYPSARRMWSSVYKHALQGRLEVTLPLATVKAVFHGVAKGRKVAVTEMRVMELAANEESDLEAPPATSLFSIHGSTIPTRMPIGTSEKQLIEILRHQQRPLTDAEWQSVQSILESEPRAHLRQLNPRAMLDGILRKLVTGHPWRSASYQVGDWRHASTTYRNWKSRGIWEEICRQLLQISSTLAMKVSAS